MVQQITRRLSWEEILKKAREKRTLPVAPTQVSPEAKTKVEPIALKDNPFLKEFFRAREPFPVSGRVTAPTPFQLGEPIPLDEVEKELARKKGETHYWSKSERAWKSVEKPKEVILSRMPFSEQLEPLGEVTPFKEIRKVGTSPEAETVKGILGFVGLVGTIGLMGWQGVSIIRSLTDLRRLPQYKAVVDYAKANNIPRNSQIFKDAEQALRTAINLKRRGADEAANKIMSRFNASYGKTMATGAARPPVPPTGIAPYTPTIMREGTVTGARLFGGERAPKGMPPRALTEPLSKAKVSEIIKTEIDRATKQPKRSYSDWEKEFRVVAGKTDAEELLTTEGLRIPEGTKMGIEFSRLRGYPEAALRNWARRSQLIKEGREQFKLSLDDLAAIEHSVTSAAQTAIPKTGQPFTGVVYRGLAKEGEVGILAAEYGTAPQGYWATERGIADWYAKEGGQVMEKQVALENPYVISEGTKDKFLEGVANRARKTAEQAGKDMVAQEEAASNAIVKAVQRKGHDGLIVNKTEGYSEVIPYTKEALKGVTTEVAPKVVTQQIKDIHVKGQTAPESVPPQEAKLAHTELAAPDGPKVPPPPTEPPTKVGEPKEPNDILREIAEKATPGERPDQTLLRLHEAAINNAKRRASIIVRDGSQKLKNQGIGVWRREQLVPRPKDIPKLDELYVALHSPSKVDSGEIDVPEGYETIYRELRGLTDWEEAARLDFNPEMATVDDYFYRGWKLPKEVSVDVQQGRPLVKTPSFKKPRVNATYQEMRDAGFEPLFWNPYQQWNTSRIQGVKYREQMELVSHLKGMGEELIRPHEGGPITQGWRVPEVGPAFEGKPFATKNPVTGEPMVMFTRRWIVPGKISNSIENIYGKKPDLGKFLIKGVTVDPMAIIDAITFIPKRAKLFVSFFQQIDFLTRSGAGGWTRFVDELLAGHPIEAIKAPARYPITAGKVLKANFNPATRRKLAAQLDSVTPLVEGRTGINLKGISEAGLSTRDVTIFPEGMDKLAREVAKEAGVLGKAKRIVGLVEDLENLLRRGLFDGVYPSAIITDIQNNIAPMIARQYYSLNDAQINGMIARIANIKYSTIPAAQSVIQNRVLRETLRRVFFSIGESEGLLRQATGAFKGPYASYWRKHWLGVYLFLITTASIIHYASTGKTLPEERYTPVSKNDWGPLPFGYNTEFASPTLPFKGRGGAELTLDLAGQMDTAFRVLDPINFVTSRESVPVRAMVNQVSGTDFYGAPIDDLGPGGVVSRTSQLIHDLFAPIGVGGITEELVRQYIPGTKDVIPRGEDRLGLGGIGLQAIGVNVRAETTGRLLDRFAEESGLTKADGTPVENWADLEPYQKKEVSSNVELQIELGLRSDVTIERQQLKAEGFATLEDIDKERVVRGEALVVEFFDKSMDATTFRKEVTLLQNEISARKGQVDADFQLFKDTGKLPEDPNDRALVEYYNVFDLAKRPSGVIDWSVQEQLENYYRKKWTDTQETYVDRNIGLTEWGPLMTEYKQAVELLDPYWELPVTPKSIRATYRLQNLDIDAALVRWYGYKPAGGTQDSGRLSWETIRERARQ